MEKLIQQGAEAKIFLEKDKNLIIKNRIPKSYRIPELDKKIRKRRTKAETKLLTKASEIIHSSKPEKYSEKEFDKIKMKFIDGKKLSEHLDKFTLKDQKEIMKIIGESIATLHREEIIHGDLTTSNMILVSSSHGNRDFQIHFIDFGLGYISRKIEDKAVDLHLLKQALEAKHFKNWEELFEQLSKSYEKTLGKEESKKVFERIRAVEKRGRYRH
jgi:Kae1-associated kinase Bud32